MIKETPKPRLHTNTSLKAIVNPRADFKSMSKANCQLLSGQNKVCNAMREALVSDPPEDYREYASLDLVVITFEGVLGTFIPVTP